MASVKIDTLSHLDAGKYGNLTIYIVEKIKNRRTIVSTLEVESCDYWQEDDEWFMDVDFGDGRGEIRIKLKDEHYPCIQ